MRKRWLKFYGHLKRMKDTRITEKNFNYINKLNKTVGWIDAVKKDANKTGVTEEIICDRNRFRLLIANATYEEDKPKPRPKRVWTDDQRRAVGEKMKKYWEERKIRKHH